MVYFLGSRLDVLGTNSRASVFGLGSSVYSLVSSV